MSKRYSPSFKFQVVLEVLQAENTEKTQAEIARAYDVHPVTVSKWKKQFMEDGPEVFGSDDEVKEAEKKIADLERMVGKKEVEIALLKNFLGDR